MLQLKLFSVIFFSLFFSTISVAQVPGCKDPAATNYNPSATLNDGSCVYPATSYSAPQVYVLNDSLAETSGLQWAGNSLWTFNDGGNEPLIYRIASDTNIILQTVRLEGASNIDWEDIAFDGTYFYIGDFGNNINGARTDLKIYKFPLNAITADYQGRRNDTIPASQIEILTFRYNKQNPVTATSPNNTRFDCEAMLVDRDTIHLFTKNWVDLKTTHYIISSTSAGNYEADSLETLDVGYLVTDADISPNGKTIVLLGYQTSGFGNHYMHVLSDYSNGLFFNGNKRRISVSNALVMGQAEGICFTSNTTGFISNERVSSPVLIAPKLRSFDISAFVPFTILLAKLKTFQVQDKNGRHQISWLFNEPVANLKIIRRTNISIPEELHQLPYSTSGTFLSHSAIEKECYQLSWTAASGQPDFSPVICVQSEKKDNLEQIVVRKSGQLSFVLNGAAGNYRFRLLSLDGKLLAETQKLVLPGATTIYFPPLQHATMVVVQLIQQGVQKAHLRYVH